MSLPCFRAAPWLLGWNVLVKELFHIPSHWLAFPDVEPMMHYSLGNGLVIWVFST